jgi:hypothetical protein
MSEHALFSPSSAHRWIECPGSFAYPANHKDSTSTYADDGTASHEWAADCLRTGLDAEKQLGGVITLNGANYEMDEYRAEMIQVYLDLVRQLALGKHLFVEHWVDLPFLGEKQGGTCDAGIIEPNMVTVIDFKYGMGEKVEAFYIENGKTLPNHQLALYAAGLIADAHLLGYLIGKVRLIVCQPRIGNISEKEFTVEEIDALTTRAARSAKLAGEALIGLRPPYSAQDYMHPGDKQCRWCRAKAECPKLAAYVAEEVRADFDTISAEPPEVLSTSTEYLGKAMIAVPLIEQWCKSVTLAAYEAVGKGREIIGSDGLPMKFVEGKLGNRKWSNPEAVEPLLVGQLGPKAYEPQSVITASAAAKLLDKKKTRQLWDDVFLPYIERPPAKPVLTLGSDTRPPYTGTATAQEFEDAPIV